MSSQLASKTLFDLFPAILLPLFTEWLRPNELVRFIRSVRLQDIHFLKAKYYYNSAFRTRIIEFGLAKRTIITAENLWGVLGTAPILAKEVFRLHFYENVRKEFHDIKKRTRFFENVAHYSKIMIDFAFADKYDFLGRLMPPLLASFKNVKSLHITGIVAKKPDLFIGLVGLFTILSELTIECENHRSLFAVIVNARSLCSLTVIGPITTRRKTGGRNWTVHYLSILGFHVCPLLASFKTNVCKYSDVALWALMDYRGSALKSLSLDRTCLITDRSEVYHFSESEAKHLPVAAEVRTVWTTLLSLTLSLCDSLTDEGLFSLLKVFPHLQSLRLQHNRNLSGLVLCHILAQGLHLRELFIEDLHATESYSFRNHDVKCSELATLRLHECSLSDRLLLDVLQAQSGRDLKILDISKNPDVSEAALLRVVRDLESVIDLNLQFCDCVTDSVVEALASACPNMQNLNLNGCARVTDRGLRAILLGCSQLKILSAEYLSTCNVSTVINLIIASNLQIESLRITTSSAGYYKELEQRMRDHFLRVKVFIRTDVKDLLLGQNHQTSKVADTVHVSDVGAGLANSYENEE